MSLAVFYHAGCPVCLGAEQMIADAIDPSKYQVDVVHLGEQGGRIAEAEAEALAEVFELNLKEVATRDDLKQMEERLNEKMDARFFQLDARFLQLEQRMIIKLGGVMVVAIGAVATLVKIL